MKKMKKYAVGGGIDDALSGSYEKKRKPLPSETIEENKRAKEINESVKDTIVGGMAGIPGAIAALGKRLKDNVMGTEEQNRMAEEREIERARKNPEGNEAKFRRATGKPFSSGGKVSSASKRADGCAIRGKTKGRMV